MATRHQHEFGLEISLGGDVCGDEIVVHVDFSYDAGEPASGPSKRGGGDPGRPDEVDVEKVTLRDASGKALDCPPWLMQRIEAGIDQDMLREIGREDQE